MRLLNRRAEARPGDRVQVRSHIQACSVDVLRHLDALRDAVEYLPYDERHRARLDVCRARDSIHRVMSDEQGTGQ